MKNDRAHKQEDVENLILEFVKNGAVWTTQQITKGVKARLVLVSEDEKRAAKRPNEAKIDSIIANALQEKRNLCKDGFIKRVRKGEFQITSAGKDKIAKDKNTQAEMSKLLNEMYPDGL